MLQVQVTSQASPADEAAEAVHAGDDDDKFSITREEEDVYRNKQLGLPPPSRI